MTLFRLLAATKVLFQALRDLVISHNVTGRSVH
jgi:hypothetical protein